MEPLYGDGGQVFGWIDLPSGRIINRDGQHAAFVIGEDIYNWHGQHVAWWLRNHVRDHAGRVALFLRGAGGLGIALPALAATPAGPAIAAVPARPALAATPARAAFSAAWANAIPFA
jgi:hypothetical protein